MFKRFKYIIAFLIPITIILYGFITVSNVMPDFIKDRSNFKVTYSSKPFDLQFDIGDYVLYLNNKAVENYKTATSNFVQNIISNNPIKKPIK